MADDANNWEYGTNTQEKTSNDIRNLWTKIS